MKLKEILKYRSAWIGFAMLWILLYHSDLTLPGTLLPFLKAIGYGGVDICLFASGAGCYFSLENDPDPICFLKRRAVKYLPSYWLFMIPWLLFCARIGHFTPQMALGNLLGIQTLTGHGMAFSWYISMLTLIYLLSPLCKHITDRFRTIPAHLLIVVLLTVLSIPFWKTSDLIVIAARFPVFYMGMAFARLCRDEHTLTAKSILPLAGVSILGFALLAFATAYFPDTLWQMGMHWYPFILITPGLCIALSLSMILMKRLHLIECILNFFAHYSFELFLVHLFVYEIVKRLIHSGNIPASPVIWILTAAISVAGAVLLSKLSHLIRRVIHL